MSTRTLSGTTVDPESRAQLEAFIQTERPTAKNPTTWMLFDIGKKCQEDKDHCIKLKETGTDAEPFDKVVSKLVESSYGYAVMFFLPNEEEKALIETSKESVFLVFILWTDDNGPVKKKMLYAASGQALKTLVSEKIKVCMQCNDKSDLVRSNIFEEVKRKNPHLFR
ncbi:actin-depolymerizing factor 8-like [Patiria miniata]|uniref:ADF-H domain-containing protein n=1 Tax=Patiria miniata TaxID=46514 RepID=A0A914BKH9_PATMI|nr:actin-depolymerizing factor 8-like [Patiria miniata]